MTVVKRFIRPGGEEVWAEVCIVSGVEVRRQADILGIPTVDEAPRLVSDDPEEDAQRGARLHAEVAPGDKCARCWRVLPEVGENAAHPALCRRCEAVVEAQERAPAGA